MTGQWFGQWNGATAGEWWGAAASVVAATSDGRTRRRRRFIAALPDGRMVVGASHSEVARMVLDAAVPDVAAPDRVPVKRKARAKKAAPPQPRIGGLARVLATLLPELATSIDVPAPALPKRDMRRERDEDDLIVLLLTEI